MTQTRKDALIELRDKVRLRWEAPHKGASLRTLSGGHQARFRYRRS
jgi:hypothetical protein